MDLGDLTDIFAKAKGTQLPLDVMAQQQQLARKQKLVDALTGAALTPSPTQMVGRIAVRQSPLEAVSKTLLGGMSGHGQKGIDDSMTSMATDYNSRSRQAIVDALSKPTEQEQADALLMSGMPEATALGTKLKGKVADRRTAFSTEAQKGMTNAGKQQVAVTGDIGAGQAAADKAYEYNPDHVQIDPVSGKPLAAMSGTITQGVTQNGSPVNIAPSGAQSAIDKAPKTTVNTNVAIAGPKAGAEEFYKEASKRYHALGQLATASLGNDKALDRMEQTMNEGAASGVGADAVTFLSNLGNTVGVPVNTSKLANSEQFRAESVKLWQDLVNKYGGNRGVTEGEAAKIMQMVPQLSQSPQGQRQLVGMLRKINAATRAEFKSFGDQLGKGFKDPEMQQFIGAVTDGYVSPAGAGVPVQGSPAAPAAPGTAPKVKSWKEF